jgi:hypothetical protein
MPLMPIILRDLPFFEAPTALLFQGRHVRIKADQIIVWVSITESGERNLHPSHPFFPAILDTGHNHNFSIRDEHLIRWAGFDPRYLTKSRHLRIAGDRLPVLEADVWLRPNERGKRDVPAEKTPFSLNIDLGIVVYPKGAPNAPRLPLLGLRALRRAELHLTIDCRRRAVKLRTTRRFWLF